MGGGVFHAAVLGPEVVPQRSDFNNLDCQTALSASTGIKSFFRYCKTGRLCQPVRCPLLTKADIQPARRSSRMTPSGPPEALRRRSDLALRSGPKQTPIYIGAVAARTQQLNQ